MFQQENSLLVPGGQPKPGRAGSSASGTGLTIPPGAPTPAQRSRNRAINIDRFSRVFFPALFTLLNVIYWILFAEYI